MTRILVAMTALLAAVLLTPASASATVPDNPASCPGYWTSREAQTAMFCRGDTPARAEGPYFVNYVDTVDGVQQFCQLRRWAPTVNECRSYWPFTNPTVNPHLAPAAAFNEDRLVATKADVTALAERAQSAERRVERQARRIHHLRARLAWLRHHR